MTTTSYGSDGLLPLRQYPKGLTVVPTDQRAAFAAACAAAREHADRYGLAVDDGPLAAMFLHMQHELDALRGQLGQARAETTAVRDQLDAATADLSCLREEQAAAALRKRQAAERRDKQLRAQVRDRDGDNCRYCCAQVSFDRHPGVAAAALDHVDPGLAVGESNVVVACRPCVKSKALRVPEAAGMVLVPAPSFPQFTPAIEENTMAGSHSDAAPTASREDGHRASVGQMVDELSAMRKDLGLPDWVNFQVNGRNGLVSMDFATLGELTVWAQALGHPDEPHRHSYVEEWMVRYSCTWADPLSGWRFDINSRMVVPSEIALTDDCLDAIEIVTGETDTTTATSGMAADLPAVRP